MLHILFILLKRFLSDGADAKNDTFIRYKLRQQNLLSENDLYEFCAVSMHMGNLTGGHYCTIARNYRIKQWYEFNDTSVSEIDPNDLPNVVITRHAYVLVYLRKELVELS